MAESQTGEWETATRAGRWSIAVGRQMVEAWRRSGESRSAFARRHGLGAHRVTYWIERVAGKSSRAGSGARGRAGDVQFARVRVVDSRPARASGSPLEVVIGAAIVRVPAGFDEEHLRRVILVLGGGA